MMKEPRIEPLKGILASGELAAPEELRTSLEAFESARERGRQARREAILATKDWRELERSGKTGNLEPTPAAVEFLDGLQDREEVKILEIWQLAMDKLVVLTRETIAPLPSTEEERQEVSRLVAYHAGQIAQEPWGLEPSFPNERPNQEHKRIDEIVVVEPERHLTDPDEILLNVVVANDRYGQRNIQFVFKQPQEDFILLEEEPD